MPTLTVRPGEADEYVIPQTASSSGDPSYQYIREYETTTKLKVSVPRDEAQAANLSKFDVLRLDGFPDHLYKTTEKGGAFWTLVAYSKELYGRTVEPLSGGVKKEGTDKEIIESLIAEVPQWSIGTVQELTGPLTFVFDDAYIHEAIRRVESNVPGELRFNDDGSIDYVDAIGTDKSGSVTLSPNAANVDGPLPIVDNGQGDSLDATHIRVTGGHEGEARPRANLVPEDDPQTYDNEIRYSTSLWSSDADTEWGRWNNPDLTDQQTLEEEANSIANEITDPVIDIRTGDSNKEGVVGEDLSLGDFVTVDKPDAAIARTMRIHRIVTQNTGGTVRDDLELSTRTYARDTDRKRVRDLHRNNIGFQGSSVVVTGGPVFRAVAPGNPLSFGFRYPDLEFEDTAEIRIEGLSYRVDSNPQPHSHPFDIDIPDHTHPIPSTQIEAGEDTDTAGGATIIQNTDDSDSLDAISAGVWNTLGTLDAGFSDSQGADLHFSMAVIDENDPGSGAGYGTSQILVRVVDDVGNYYPDSSGIPYNVGKVAVDTNDDGTVDSWTPGEIDDEINIPEDTDSREYTVEIQPQVDDHTVSWELFLTVYDEHSHPIGGKTVASNTSDGGGAYFKEETSDTTAGFEPGIFTTNDTPSNVDVEINGTTVATDIGSGTFREIVDVAGDFTTDSWNTITIRSDTLGIVNVTPYLEGYDQVSVGN